MTIALTVRGKPSGASMHGKEYQQQQYPTPPSSSPSVSSSPTATFLGGSGGYREGNVTPLKVVASVKRIVELIDEYSPTVGPATPSSSKVNNSSNDVPPPPPPHHPVACAREGPSRGSFGFYKRAKQSRRPPTAPGPVASMYATTSLAVVDDKHARHKSLTPEMERRIAGSSIRGGGPLNLASGSRGLVIPSSADVRETGGSPEGTLVGSSSASSSTSDAESVTDDDDAEDDATRGKEGNRTYDKCGRVSVPMELDGPPALNYSNFHATPPSATDLTKDGCITAGTGTGISNSGGFSLLEHFPWASSFSSSSPSPSPSPARMAAVNDAGGLAAATARKKCRDKKTLYEESASFPRVPLTPLAQLCSTHEGNSKTSTNTLVPLPYPSTPAYEGSYPSSPHHCTAITTAPAANVSPSDEKAGFGVAISQPNAAGTYATTLMLKIPTPKSTYHWAVGETLRTGLVRVRFVIGCKVRIFEFFLWKQVSNALYFFSCGADHPCYPYR